jgi:hypothetical protein
MTQEFIDRLFAAVMGKCWHEPDFDDVYKEDFEQKHCRHCKEYYYSNWSPSINGEATKEVRDWFAKEMPEEWESYLQGIAISPAPQRNNDTFFTETYDRQSSITNLAQHIIEHYKEMFFEECPECYGQGSIDLGHIPEAMTTMHCDNCNGTGLIVKPEFAAVVKVIEEMKEGKE